ncbi:MAG: hypothetical protein GXY38_00445 [Planctomycetes bacterium]|jgi:hypothetical protein|nr:hypothetical protein [Planctomycetota bacterium]
MACPAADIFRRGADILRNDSRRTGNVVTVAAPCEIMLTGDLHGDRQAMTRIVQACGIKRSADKYLLLQEVIHGSIEQTGGTDRSIDLLLRAVRLLIECPEQVLFVMGNHDLAQATGGEISKDSCNVCRAFTQGVEYAYAQQAPEVMEAVNEFLLAMPLAVRLPNRIFVSHSLPTPQRMELAGMEILSRQWTQSDLHRGGPMYEWTWGRSHTEQFAQQLAQQIDVDLFVIGHRHVEDGVEVIGEHALILNSDGPRGCVLPMDCSKPYTVSQAMAAVVAVSALPAA